MPGSLDTRTASTDSRCNARQPTVSGYRLLYSPHHARIQSEGNELIGNLSSVQLRLKSVLSDRTELDCNMSVQFRSFQLHCTEYTKRTNWQLD